MVRSGAEQKVAAAWRLLYKATEQRPGFLLVQAQLLHTNSLELGEANFPRAFNAGKAVLAHTRAAVGHHREGAEWGAGVRDFQRRALSRPSLNPSLLLWPSGRDLGKGYAHMRTCDDPTRTLGTSIVARESVAQEETLFRKKSMRKGQTQYLNKPSSPTYALPTAATPHPT
jgi:hypothetical protein